jgi:hypothetical protein
VLDISIQLPFFSLSFLFVCLRNSYAKDFQFHDECKSKSERPWGWESGSTGSVPECLPSKCEALSSGCSTTKGKKKSEHPCVTPIFGVFQILTIQYDVSYEFSFIV